MICSTKCEFLASLAFIRGQAYRSQTRKWFRRRPLLLGYMDLLWVCVKESNCSFSRFTFPLAESHRTVQASVAPLLPGRPPTAGWHPGNTVARVGKPGWPEEGLAEISSARMRKTCQLELCSTSLSQGCKSPAQDFPSALGATVELKKMCAHRLRNSTG